MFFEFLRDEGHSQIQNIRSALVYVQSSMLALFTLISTALSKLLPLQQTLLQFSEVIFERHSKKKALEYLVSNGDLLLIENHNQIIFSTIKLM